MSSEGRTALLVGATGLVGGHCLTRLLAEPRYQRVVVLVRRRLEMDHPRLESHVVDFDQLDGAPFAHGHDVYCCLGTTIKAAGSREAFRKVDHDYAFEVARLARAGGASGFALVSSVGASVDSKTFYLRVKGETERDIAALKYPTFEIFRPSLLLGERRDKRLGERFATAASHALSWTLRGRLARYHPVEGDAVAAAMISALGQPAPGIHVREYDAIREFARAQIDGRRRS